MNVPYPEWSIAGVRHAVYSNPKNLVSPTDKKRFGSGKFFPITSDVGISISGELSNINGASLWINERYYISMVDDTNTGPMWHDLALRDVELTNELCWPYQLVVHKGFWIARDSRNGDDRVYRAMKNFNDLPKLTSQTVNDVCMIDDLLTEFVSSLNPTPGPDDFLCSRCAMNSPTHLKQHIARKEISNDLLGRLIGWDGVAEPWTDECRRHLLHVLRWFYIDGREPHRVKCFRPREIEDWCRGLQWIDPYSKKGYADPPSWMSTSE